MMITRYDTMFSTLQTVKSGAFVPFVVLGDPDLETSARILRTLINAGADALEVGIAFSDPIADGPTIQAASQRALGAGVTQRASFDLIASLRTEYPHVPIGVLTYANLVVRHGRSHFYEQAAKSGVDSVLVADVPVFESHPFVKDARAAGVAPILIAPPNAPDQVLSSIASLGAGYTYCVARAGVTGADDIVHVRHEPVFQKLTTLGAPPPMLGFGISKPEHVKAAVTAGAAGAISGSAIATLIGQYHYTPEILFPRISEFVQAMKSATHYGA